MVKHWFENQDGIICDILHSNCILKSKYCLNCDIYEKWKKTPNGKPGRK